MSIRQQALRGIAKVALERGNKKEARHQYERILGKALIGRGPPAAHWAHSEYAWLLFEDGNLEVCTAAGSQPSPGLLAPQGNMTVGASGMLY